MNARTSNSVAALLEPGIKHTVSDSIQRTKAASFTCFHPAKKIDEDEVSTVSWAQKEIRGTERAKNNHGQEEEKKAAKKENKGLAAMFVLLLSSILLILLAEA